MKNRIAELRNELGITQRKLACMLDKEYSTVCKWETSVNEPSQKIINQLCDIFGCDSDYLMGHSDINTRKITLSENQLPEELRKIGFRNLTFLRDYIDSAGGIHADVLKELLRLASEAKVLSDNPDHKD